MSEDIYFFKRMEKKYLLDDDGQDRLFRIIKDRLIEDEHGKSTISSLYLDTPDYRIIRQSIEAKEWGSAYKEKLRIRSYGIPDYETPIFFELKKKYKGTVYKRREKMMLSSALNYIKNGELPFDTQIMREIDYSMRFYGNPQPFMLISYEREAYYLKGIPTHRITFDKSLRYRTEDLTPKSGDLGKLIIPQNTVIMEIKTDGAMPLWLVRALDDCKIYPCSFSKYATSYRDFIKGE